MPNAAPDDDTAPKDDSIQGPHNRFVLGIYGAPREARSLLAAQLPSALLERVDLDQLEVEKSHFVDESMAELESDLLFRIPRTDRPGTDCFVYVLWEHQRRRDSLMALRMWLYLGMIYRHLAKEKQLPGDGKLPYVYPIVLFQGTEGWSKGLVLEDLIDSDGLEPKLMRWIPRFEIDLIRLDEDTPRIEPDDTIARLGLSLMRAVMKREVGQWLEDNIGELNRVFGEQHDPVILILTYALKSGAGLTSTEFRNIIQTKGDPKMDYETGSVADQLVKEGEKRGEKKGEKRGREKTRTETALRLIQMGLDDSQIARATELPLNAVSDLRREHEG